MRQRATICELCLCLGYTVYGVRSAILRSMMYELRFYDLRVMSVSTSYELRSTILRSTSCMRDPLTVFFPVKYRDARAKI